MDRYLRQQQTALCSARDEQTVDAHFYLLRRNVEEWGEYGNLNPQVRQFVRGHRAKARIAEGSGNRAFADSLDEWVQRLDVADAAAQALPVMQSYEHAAALIGYIGGRRKLLKSLVADTRLYSAPGQTKQTFLLSFSERQHPSPAAPFFPELLLPPGKPRRAARVAWRPRSASSKNSRSIAPHLPGQRASPARAERSPNGNLQSPCSAAPAR